VPAARVHRIEAVPFAGLIDHDGGMLAGDLDERRPHLGTRGVPAVGAPGQEPVDQLGQPGGQGGGGSGCGGGDDPPRRHGQADDGPIGRPVGRLRQAPRRGLEGGKVGIRQARDGGKAEQQRLGAGEFQVDQLGGGAGGAEQALPRAVARGIMRLPDREGTQGEQGDGHQSDQGEQLAAQAGRPAGPPAQPTRSVRPVRPAHGRVQPSGETCCPGIPSRCAVRGRHHVHCRFLTLLSRRFVVVFGIGAHVAPCGITDAAIMLAVVASRDVDTPWW
jgi:hypothetical protein